jgi:hypothetical protein
VEPATIDGAARRDALVTANQPGRPAPVRDSSLCSGFDPGSPG